MSYEVELGRFFTVGLKKTSDVDLVKPMETFIKNTFDKTDEDLMKHIREFNAMRKNTTKTLDKSASSLNVLYSYYDQLVAASSRVPFREASGVHISFSWKDSLQKGKFLSSTPKLSIVDGEFERLCVLYNIAALMTQVGSEANLQTDDGLKLAAKYFQESAGIFAYIKERIMSVVGSQTVTTDLAPEVLNAFKNSMVAQAQECFYDKASSDPGLNKKPEILAKIAMQASHLYAEASKAFQESDSGYSITSILVLMNAKKDLFHIRAQHHQARAANDKKQFGESIARYKSIEPVLKALMKSSMLESLPNFNGKQLYAVITSELEAVEKDNNFIYNDVVPKASSLSPINKAQIAKAKNFTPEDKLSSKFNDLFSSLVPLTVHNALEAYEARRKEIVDRQIERMREQNTLINGVMSSLNLPAALEDMSGSEIPASILEKSKIVVSKGGAASIDQLLQDLPDSLERNQEILTECIRILNEEQSSDAELREKFGEKWKRKPSSELTAPLRQEASKYQTIIENAQKADGLIRGKYRDNKEGIDLLSLPEPQLKNAVPSASPIAALKDHSVVKELKGLCEQVETLKAEREVVENDFKTTTCDMTSKFVQVLAEEEVLNEEDISPGELDRIYQPLIQQANSASDRQESILFNIQRCSEEFIALKKQGGGVSTREEVLKKMAAAFDGYQELSANLQEGNKFYNDLSDLLLKLQGKCSDLVFARKTEKEELLKDLQQSIVSSQTSSAPTVIPSYHSQPPQEDVYAQVKKPPTRPPPPTTTNQAAPAQQPPKPVPRKATAPAPPVPAPSAPGGVPSTAPQPGVPQPGAPQQFPAHQQPPYGYPQGAPPPQQSPAGYPHYPAYGQPTAPYPGQPYGYPQAGGYAPQGYGAYPQQPQYPGYPQQPQNPAYPQQPHQGYGQYPGQPPYQPYPPQQ